MAAVIVPKDSAANAVPYNASISPIGPPYIKMPHWQGVRIEALRRDYTTDTGGPLAINGKRGELIEIRSEIKSKILHDSGGFHSGNSEQK